MWHLIGMERVSGKWIYEREVFVIDGVGEGKYRVLYLLSDYISGGAPRWSVNVASGTTG